METRHTVASVAALIAKNVEPEIAEEVLLALRPLDGQLITARMLDKLPGGRVEWRLSRTLGWTEIRNRANVRNKRDGVMLLLARSDQSVPLSIQFVERENAEFLEGRRQRNALRAQALADVELLSRVASLMNEIEDLNQKHQTVKQQFAAFLESGEPLSPDQYELERACGLREPKEQT